MKTTKKEYSFPRIDIYTIELQQVIANSFTPSDTTTSGTVTDDIYNGEFSSREFDYDEEEE